MSCCAATLTSSDQLKETERRLARLEHDRVMAGSINLGGARYKTDYVVPDMHCVACIGTIERGLAALAPVEQVRANLSRKTVTVIWNSEGADGAEIGSAIRRLGFENHLTDRAGGIADDEQSGKSLLLALAVAGFAAANIMLLSVSIWSGTDPETTQLFHLISGLIAVPAVAFSGRPFFHSALKALLAGRLNMDVPISLAVLLGLAMSLYESVIGGQEAYFDASVTLLFFLLIGRYLDTQMRHRARGAVQRLHSLAAKDGVVVDSSGEISHIALADIETGMKLRIYAGERLPVNGRILSGNSEFDRSHVTGESDLLTAEPGEVLEAGTLNLSGVVDIEAISTAENSFLGEMQRMISMAEQGRGKYLRIADRLARIYAPVVHLLALVTFCVWMVMTGLDWHASLYTAIAVLIITCPCALGLAVPVAHVVGANRLMQNGILIRDGTALERLEKVDTVVFDKTGTLTTGQPRVLRADNLDEDLLPLLKSVAGCSVHPIARALQNYSHAYDEMSIGQISEHPGKGVETQWRGKKVRLGKPDWAIRIASVNCRQPGDANVAFAVEQGKPMFYCVKDSPRESAKQAIADLQIMDLKTEILSGDKASNVAEIASRLDMKAYLSDQSPAEKIERLKLLQKQGRHVLMVGDGINDAPALAGSDVSIVPASASDIGRHSADFVFVRQSLQAVPFAIEAARITGKTVRQNFALAIAYNCIAIPLAMGGYVTPLIAAIAMSASSIVVIANSLRINMSMPSRKSEIASGAGRDRVRISEVQT